MGPVRANPPVTAGRALRFYLVALNRYIDEHTIGTAGEREVEPVAYWSMARPHSQTKSNVRSFHFDMRTGTSM